MAHFTRTDDTHPKPSYDDAPSSHKVFDYDVQNGQPLLQQYNTEHVNASGMEQQTPTPTQPPDDLDSTFNSEQQLPLHDKSDFILGTTSVQDMTRQPSSCRRASAPSTIGQAVLDICITTASIYFVAFALMAVSQNGKSAASVTARHLLDAARLVSYNCSRFGNQDNADRLTRVPPSGQSCFRPSLAAS
jgi:hypothetical protein